ncbi:MAG: phospholipase D-like domain-containing protein, partial [Desulfobacterales bacterium]
YAERTETIIGRYAGWLNDLPPQILTERAGLSPGSEGLNRLTQKNDSRLVHYTCHSYFDALLDANVQIFGFTGGLLHTKSIVVDGEISLFGTVNMDIRSFWLDFEVTLCSYDPGFARQLRALQQKYIEDSEAVDPVIWRSRPSRQRFIENMVRLASPLL